MSRKTLISRIEGEAVFLSVQYTMHESMHLHGTTVPCSARSGGSNLTNLIIYPEPGKDGIIAITLQHVKVGHRDRAMYSFDNFFLKVTWKQKEGEEPYPFVDIENPWFSAERIGQATRDGIDVVIKGIRFTTYPHGIDKNERNIFHVPDGDLLCHYLWGTADAADVLHAAIQRKLEPILQERIAKMTNEVRVLENIERMRQDQVRHLSEQVKRLEDSIRLAADTLKEETFLEKFFGRLPFSGRSNTSGSCA